MISWQPKPLIRLFRTHGFQRLFGATAQDLGAAFDELIKHASFLRLPADHFDNKFALMSIGSLGPGGAERQLVYTAIGLTRATDLRVGVCVENLSPPVANFHEATLRKAGVSIHVVSLGKNVEYPGEIRSLLSHLSRRFFPLNFEHLARDIIDYALLLRELRPGLIHTWMDACNVRVGLAAALVGVPRIVLSGRSMAPYHFALHQDYMRPGYTRVLSLCTPRFLNNSAAGAADYARWLGIETHKIRCIRNGFEFVDDISDRRARVRGELGLADEDLVLGGIMRFTEEKQPGLWAEVAAEFVRHSKGRRAFLFGDGPLRRTILDKVRHWRLEQKIIVPGIAADTWDTLAAMDIFLLTSRMEGLPNVLIEAQACGVPVITTAVGGAPECVLHGETGLVVDCEHDAVKSACLSLADDPMTRRKMGERAVIFARNEFSLERMLTDVLKVYLHT